MNSLPPQDAFLSSEYEKKSADEALFHVVPVPLEQTVSYGGGSRNGPQAILDASYQLEAFDGVSFPGEAGIHTTPPVDCEGEIGEVLNRIEGAAKNVFDCGKIPVFLGGEHSLTQAPIRALSKLRSEFGVVQIDAHADLRDEYEGSPWSHACVMRRVVELGIPAFQIGVRNLCREEIEFRAETAIAYFDAMAIHRDGLPSRLLPADFPKNIYLTFDVDGLDASLMPATGAPEPGGLFWHDALAAVENCLQVGRSLIGLDVVELAPIPGFHSADYVTAKLTYALMGFAARSRQ